MADAYQAVYDAARTAMRGDFVGAIREAAERHFDISFAVAQVRDDISYNVAIVRAAMTRPSVLYRPDLAPDGTKWCALLGSDLMNGIAGFGDTPEEAMLAFDKAFKEEGTPEARRLARFATEAR